MRLDGERGSRTLHALRKQVLASALMLPVGVPRRFGLRPDRRPASNQRRLSPAMPLATRALAALACVLSVACGPNGSGGVSVLQDCVAGAGPKGAKCGTVTVFEDREAATGRTIDLNVVVFPALDADPAPDPLFLLAGGPAGPAAQLSGVVAPHFRGVQEDRDLVFVGQRGTGELNGGPCEVDSNDLTTHSNARATIEAQRACLDGYGADLRLYTTPIAMDDLDEVRERLGYGKINLWGHSYTTRATLVYLRRHGDHVRSVVLDGAVPFTMTPPVTSEADFGRALDLTLAACEADESCRERYPGLRGRLFRLLARLDREPAAVTAVHPRTGARVPFVASRQFVVDSLRSSLFSAERAAMVPMLVNQAERGEFGGLLALVLERDIVSTAMAIHRELQLPVLCADDQAAAGRDVGASTPTGPLRLGTAALWHEMCAGGTWGNMGPAYRDPVRSGVPALILSGEMDPATPPRWGEVVAGNLPNSKHVIVPGVAHGTSTTGCVPELIEQFIRAGSASGIDESCVERLRRPPFFLSPEGPSKGGVG